MRNLVSHRIGTQKEWHIDQTLPLFNPATGDQIGSVAIADKTICDVGVKTARTAFLTWSEVPPMKRARVLFQFRTLLERYQNDLATIVTREHGKTLEDAKGSIARAIELVEFHCGLMQQMQSSFSFNVAQNIDCVTIRQPLGVCLGISPFNFPVMVPVWMMIPAIACGNTMIIKPSEQDPSSVNCLVEWLMEAGLPPGVVNVIHGDRNTAEYLIEHPDIAAVTAVASTQVARSIYQKAVTLGKRAHTFGGAKNHAVIMPDADIADTAKAIVGAAYGSAGERCMAISVVVAIGDNVADQFIHHLKPLVQNIRVDAGESLGADMGPLISEAHRNRVLKAIEAGIQEGAKLVIDGRNFKHPHHAKGYYLGPCLFDQVHAEMSIYQEEIFGPVLCVVRVPDFETAISLVNTHQYGNGTAIFTQDPAYARLYMQRVQVGMVGVNIPIPVPIASHPFGGWKQSAFGDTGMHGTESLHFYSRAKTMTMRWTLDASAKGSFSMPTHTTGE